MKDLIVQALDEANVNVERRVPQTKKETKYLSIYETLPITIPQIMQDSDVPDDAELVKFDSDNDGYDDICLAWDIDVPTTDKDKMDFRRRAFDSTAFRFVSNLLITNGYKRISYDGIAGREFRDIHIYDLYIAKDFDRLVKYYSLSFKKD